MAKRVRRSNVKDGVLLPLGNGFSLVKGDNPNKTDDVDIGPNNKNGLSVNHGEILQQQGNTLRVFSAEPMLGGVSPVQLLYGGMTPDKVFAMQEAFKDIHGINDDGSKAQFGTEKVVRNKQTWDTILNDEQEVAFNDWYKNISSKLKLNSNPNDYNHHYDYRGYWLENKNNNIDYSEKDFHFPDKYKKPTHETFSNESIYATEEYGINPKTVGHWKDNVFIPGSFNILMNNNYKNSLEKEGFYYSDDKQLSLRQRYAESSFNDKALNKWSKAAGAYQIMPHIHKAYVKATGHEGDLYDLEYNTAIRNWLMRDINKNAYIKDLRNNNRNKIIKTYAAYNWGSGNLGKLLKRLEKEGIDTFNSYDWINKLPKETKDYVNFIVHGDDVNGVKNSKKYKESLDSLRTKKEFGGEDNIPMRIDSEGNLIDSIQPSVITAKLPAKFNGSQAAAARYAEGYKFGKKVAKKRDETAPYFMPLVMGPLAPNAILSEMGGKSVDSLIQQATNYKKTGWSDAVTSFLDDNSKTKRIGETIADFINPGYMLGSIATPIKSSLINSNWKPSIKSKYDTVPSSIKNTLNIDTEANKRLRNIIAKQVGNTTENLNRQKQIYNKALYYLGQAFDDVPENIQNDILNNTEILDNFITRVRWGEGKDMVSSLKYEANKTANIFKQNDIAKKRLKYRYKNVPTLLKNPLHNETSVFQSVVNTHGKHIANKARYKLAQLLMNKGYTNTIGLNRDILNNIFDIATGMNPNYKGYKPLIYIPERNLTTNTKYNIDKFVKKYGKSVNTDPAEGIINPELQEIARISPKYAGQIYAKEVLGDTPEEIVNDLLTKKWSFIRGINDATGTLNIEDAKVAMGKIAENAKGGRSDIRVFPSILPSEDVAYFSNSPTTAISYTYPTQQGTGYIGIFGKKGRFVEGNNLIDKWIKNQLPDDNILEAPSTITKDTPGIKIDEDKLKSFEIGLKRGRNRGKLQGAGEADNYFYYLTKPNRNDSGYRHFLIKGNRGEQIPYLELKDIREVPKASVNSDEFNLLLKEFDVDAHDLNRGHNNKPSLSFSLGKQFGGQANVNSLGERPNAKYRKQMKNKRNKAALGRQQFSISGLPAFDFTVPNTFGNYSLNKPFYPTYVDGPLIGLRVPQSTLNIPAFPTNFVPKSTVGQVDPFMGTKPAFGTSITGTQRTNSVGDLTKGSGLSTTAMSAIGAGINTLGALIGAGIQQNAINSIKAPQRQYTLLSPVKLKTKININPQIARMREMQAQLADAARRTSGSSRNTYQKILANHNRLLDSAMDLYGRKENIETELINRDRLNQQQVAHTNATNVMNTINYNNEAATEMRNRQRVATSNNWTTALNTTAGAWAGPNGFIDRANALRVKAGELYTQAIANPTAARLLYGDIDFTTGANKRRAFNTIYDFLNNNRFA